MFVSYVQDTKWKMYMEVDDDDDDDGGGGHGDGTSGDTLSPGGRSRDYIKDVVFTPNLPPFDIYTITKVCAETHCM